MTSASSLGEMVFRLRADANQYINTVDQVNVANIGMARTFGIVIAAVTALGVAGVREATLFESSFAGIRKTVNGTEEDFRQLEEGMRGMSLKIPVNVNDLNKIGEAAGQLGIAKENILDFTKTVAAMGVATNLSADQAATEMARFANITGMSQQNFDKLGSTIVALGNKSATTEAEIMSMAMRIAGAGTTVGMKIPDIISFSAALSSVGIEAEAGGTAFSQAMIKMAQAVNNGSEELKVFAAAAGLTSDEFTKLFKTDPSQVMIRFVQGLGEINKSGGNVFQVLEGLGMDGIRLTDVFLRAANSAGVFRSALKTGQQGWDENNALAKEAAQRYATFASQLTILVNRVRDMFITIGQKLLPVLEILVKYITESQDATGNWGGTVEVVAEILKGLLVVVLSLGAVVVWFINGVIKMGTAIILDFVGLLELIWRTLVVCWKWIKAVGLAISSTFVSAWETSINKIKTIFLEFQAWLWSKQLSMWQSLNKLSEKTGGLTISYSQKEMDELSKAIEENKKKITDLAKTDTSIDVTKLTGAMDEVAQAQKDLAESWNGTSAVGMARGSAYDDFNRATTSNPLTFIDAYLSPLLEETKKQTKTIEEGQKPAENAPVGGHTVPGKDPKFDSQWELQAPSFSRTGLEAGGGMADRMIKFAEKQAFTLNEIKNILARQAAQKPAAATMAE